VHWIVAVSFETDHSDMFFRCTQCGECCRGFGGTYVSDTDIAAIADFLGMPVAVVRINHCTSSGGRLVLSQRADGFCSFWDGNCTIHPVKPRMCRQWPFIAGLEADIGNWQIMAGMCPGMQANVSSDRLVAYLKRHNLYFK
jgi:Fe-S-cluster containining protein